MFYTSSNGYESIRASLNLEDKFIVLYAGAHGMSNDLEVLLNAAEITIDNNNIKYILVGDGKEKNNLTNMAKDKNLTNVLFFANPFLKSACRVLSLMQMCVLLF